MYKSFTHHKKAALINEFALKALIFATRVHLPSLCSVSCPPMCFKIFVFCRISSYHQDEPVRHETHVKLHAELNISIELTLS
jgi:hypothetical protein